MNPFFLSFFFFFFSTILLLPVGELDEGGGLLRAKGTNGECRVICFSPNHSLTVAEMEVGQIRKVVDEWVFQSEDLAKTYTYAQIFENKGEHSNSPSTWSFFTFSR